MYGAGSHGASSLVSPDRALCWLYRTFLGLREKKPLVIKIIHFSHTAGPASAVALRDSPYFGKNACTFVRCFVRSYIHSLRTYLGACSIIRLCIYASPALCFLLDHYSNSNVILIFSLQTTADVFPSPMHNHS